MTVAAAAQEAPLIALEREVVSLRTTLRDVSTRVQLRWEAELASLQERIQDGARLEAGARKEWERFAAEALALIEATKLRPKRARLKDLARIRALARTLRERAP